MNFKDEFKKFPKDIVYDMYTSIVYDIKDYDDISRNQMLDQILKEYSQENFLYHICTEKELKFLDYIKNNKLNKITLVEYDWEIDELHKKGIFSRVTLDVFAEQRENVDSALEYYKEHKLDKENDDALITFMISIIKINVEMLEKAFVSMISSFCKMTEEAAENLLLHPLFHFYCDIYKKYIETYNDCEEVIVYRDNWSLLDDLAVLKKEYGLAGSRECDIRDNFDIFYYGFPIRVSSVKKMYDRVSSLPNKSFIFDIIDEARILNNRDGISMFLDDEDLINIINDALDDIPCAVMNGFTPREYRKEKAKELELNTKFIVEEQEDAHLSHEDAKLFYKLYFALLEYVNNKYKIEESIDKIYQQHGLDPSKLYKINEYLFNNRSILDDFIKDNLYKFNNQELDIIAGFKDAIQSDTFVVVGFLKEYTEILSKEGKIYMVKGINVNMDEVFVNRKLPILISTTLLPFDGYIIYNSFCSEIPITMGNDFKKMIVNDYNKAIHYYHL